MNRGLRPVLDAVEFDGCPFCSSEPTATSMNGPSEILSHGCGHVIDTKAWADTRYARSNEAGPDRSNVAVIADRSPPSGLTQWIGRASVRGWIHDGVHRGKKCF